MRGRERCDCERGLQDSVYQQAVVLGVSVFVSAGDEGAASCDADSGERHPRHRRQRLRL